MKYLLFFILLISCNRNPQSHSIEYCYDIVISPNQKDSTTYYINIDWAGKCARLVKELNDKRDTYYLYEFDCFQSKDIDKEIKKK